VKQLFVLGAMVLTGCVQMPETYAPPVQRQPLDQARPYRISRVVRMGDPDAAMFFVQDITPGKAEGGVWRWTGKRPTVKVRLRTVENQKLSMDFTIPEVTFAKTGPVTVTFFVNGQQLDQVRYDSPGARRYEKPVPKEWLKANEENLVAAEIDKTFDENPDGSKLGFILTSLGLTQ
jgi:hypothetical protein